MRALIPALLSLSVIACATTAGYEKQLNNWVGKQEVDLVRSWGPPNQTYEAGGRRFLVYVNRRDLLIEGTAASLSVATTGNTKLASFVPATPDRTVTLTCRTSFELTGGRVAGWSHKGDDCKASS